MTLSEKETDAILQKVYYDSKIGLVSADRLYKKLKSQGITRKQVSEFLRKQQVQQLHYQSKKPTYSPEHFANARFLASYKGLVLEAL